MTGRQRGGCGRGDTFDLAGEQADPTFGLVHLRARDYAPGLGRLLSRDPVAPSAAGSHRWQPSVYATNNLTTVTDPSGQVAHSTFTGR